MATRDRAAIVCRDCGEVTHYELAAVKPDALLSCGACGLTIDQRAARLPALSLLGAPSSGPPPRRTPPRLGRAR